MPPTSPDQGASRQKHSASAGVRRLGLPEDIDEEVFASAHGQLIALGYLSVDVNAKSGGVLYRPTREGLRHLRWEEIESEKSERDSA